MPQAMSKCRSRLRWSISIPITKGQSETVRIQSKRNKFKCNNQRLKRESPLVATTTTAAAGRLIPGEVEDWEKEIEEFSRRTKKAETTKMTSETCYDPEDELNLAVHAMTLYNVSSAPSPTQEHYSPSVHHVPPVKWVRHVYTVVLDQFADAEG